MYDKIKMNCKQPSIEDVPEEVMIEVFLYLSPKLLKVAALVCKRWNEIISQSPKTLKPYLLNLVPSPRKKIPEGVSIDRKVTALKTNILSEPVVDYMRSRILTHLELNKLTIAKQQLAEILALATNVTSLVFHKTKLEELSRGVEVHPVKFLKLERIGICKSDTEILGLIATTSLTEFSSVRDSRQTNITDDEVKMLVQQKFLKSLHLDWSFDAIFFERLRDFPFKLQKVSILYAERTKVGEFLLLQKDSLEDIRLWYLPLAAFYLFYIPNLRSLTVPHLMCPEDVPTLKKLERLSAPFVPGNKLEAARFHVALKNMRAYETGLLDGIAHIQVQTLQQIESLGLPTDGEFGENTVLANLKELKFTRNWPDEDTFNKIIRNHSRTLEKLTIDLIDDSMFSRGTTIDAIRACTRLKLLSVGCNTPLIPHMFRKISFNHPWTFEVSYKKKDSPVSLRDCVNESEWLKVVFKFPDDEAVFKGHCTTWDDDMIRDFDTVKDYGVNAFINQFK